MPGGADWGAGEARVFARQGDGRPGDTFADDTISHRPSFGPTGRLRPPGICHGGLHVIMLRLYRGGVAPERVGRPQDRKHLTRTTPDKENPDEICSQGSSGRRRIRGSDGRVVAPTRFGRGPHDACAFI